MPVQHVRQFVQTPVYVLCVRYYMYVQNFHSLYFSTKLPSVSNVTLCMRCTITVKGWNNSSLNDFEVHISWEGHKILRNFHQLFVLCTASQIIGGDFAKFCDFLRIYELYRLGGLANVAKKLGVLNTLPWIFCQAKQC